jgi:hypothetical protein
MFFMSGSQAQTFAAAAQTMTERIRKLGPNPLKNGRVTKDAEDVATEEVSFRGRIS